MQSPSCFSLKNPERREKKSCLTMVVLLLGESLLFRLVALLLFSSFWPLRKKACFHTKLQTFWRNRGGEIPLLFCSFFRFSFLFFSLTHFPPYPKLKRAAIKHKKQMCFSNYQKKRFFSQTFSPSLCDCDYDGNVQRMSCAGCCVWFLSLPLLHVTCLIENCHPRQAIGDRIHDRICDARLNIVGLVLLLHVGGTGRYVYMVHEHEVLNLASSIYIYFYAMQHGFSCHFSNICQQHNISLPQQGLFSSFPLPPATFYTAVVYARPLNPRTPK
jgi:hypothetical protein